MEEVGGENGSVSHALKRVSRGSGEESFRLSIAQSRGFALVGALRGPFDAVGGVSLDGVVLAEKLKERGERGELPADGRGRQLTGLELLAPGQDVSPGHIPKFPGLDDAGEAHEFLHVVHVGAPRVPVVDVGEPLKLSRDFREALELVTGEDSGLGVDLGQGAGI